MVCDPEDKLKNHKAERIMLNENVKKLLKENMWDLATCAASVPSVVPVAFKDVTDDGKLVVGDVLHDAAQPRRE